VGPLAGTHDDAEEKVREAERHTGDHGRVAVVRSIKHRAEPEVPFVHTLTAECVRSADELAVVVMTSAAKLFVVRAAHRLNELGRVPIADQGIDVVRPKLFNRRAFCFVASPDAELAVANVPLFDVRNNPAIVERPIVVDPGVFEVSLKGCKLRACEVAEDAKHLALSFDRLRWVMHGVARIMRDDAIVNVDPLVLECVDLGDHLSGRVAEPDEDKPLPNDIILPERGILPSKRLRTFVRPEHTARIRDGHRFPDANRIDHDRELSRLLFALDKDRMVEISRDDLLNGPFITDSTGGEVAQESNHFVAAARCGFKDCPIKIDTPGVISRTIDDILLRPDTVGLATVDHPDVPESEPLERKLDHDAGWPITDDCDRSLEIPLRDPEGRDRDIRSCPFARKTLCGLLESSEDAVDVDVLLRLCRIVLEKVAVQREFANSAAKIVEEPLSTTNWGITCSRGISCRRPLTAKALRAAAAVGRKVPMSVASLR
jgi:hypothetical protein